MADILHINRQLFETNNPGVWNAPSGSLSVDLYFLNSVITELADTIFKQEVICVLLVLFSFSSGFYQAVL